MAQKLSCCSNSNFLLGMSMACLFIGHEKGNSSFEGFG